MGASPGAALALTQMNAEIDVRRVLPSVHVPTLVIHRTADRCLKLEEGRYVAENIPGAKFVELPGQDHLPFVGDQDSILDEVEEFLTGVRHTLEPDTVLATVCSHRSSIPNNMSSGWATPVGMRCWIVCVNTAQRNRVVSRTRDRHDSDRPLAIFEGRRAAFVVHWPSANMRRGSESRCEWACILASVKWWVRRGKSR